MPNSSTANLKTNTLSVGVVPVFFNEKKVPLFLLLRVYGYWDFPKGVMEKDEDPKKTAMRELAEETGIAHPQFNWGDVFEETEPYARGKIARYYLAEIAEKTVELLKNPVTGQIEHHEFRWCTVAEAEVILNDRVKKILYWATGELKRKA